MILQEKLLSFGSMLIAIFSSNDIQAQSFAGNKEEPIATKGVQQIMFQC